MRDKQGRKKKKKNSYNWPKFLVCAIILPKKIKKKKKKKKKKKNFKEKVLNSQKQVCYY
jgi:hypothetical protein